MHNLEEQSAEQNMQLIEQEQEQKEQPHDPPRFSIPKGVAEGENSESFSFASGPEESTILSQFSEVRGQGLRVLEGIEGKYRKMVESLPKIALKMEMEQAFMETCEIVR